jgi:hypothetical protein
MGIINLENLIEGTKWSKITELEGTEIKKITEGIFFTFKDIDV